jgi:DNA-binding PadR family transcriptional regulator
VKGKARAVRLVLADHQPHGLYALDIADRTRLGAGSLYPLLARLERDGVVTSVRVDDAGRRRYRLVTS